MGRSVSRVDMGRISWRGVGVVVDGAPAGISLSEEDIQKCLDRRKPGETKYSTPRKEGDKVKNYVRCI